MQQGVFDVAACQCHYDAGALRVRSPASAGQAGENEERWIGYRITPDAVSYNVITDDVKRGRLCKVMSITDRFSIARAGKRRAGWRAEREQGRLDILVNNVINLSEDVKQKPPFWEQGPPVWDSYHQVGLR